MIQRVKWLHEDALGHLRTHRVTTGYTELHEDNCKVHEDTQGYMRLHMVT